MLEKFRTKPFYCKIAGEYALFTDPATKGGGEKFSYSVPTYQALKGIIEGAYWKPSLYYVINEVKVMQLIKSVSKNVLYPMSNQKQDRFVHTYLVNVEYLVNFHFEWNTERENTERDFDEIKHTQILLRSLERGGRRDIFLGTRECIGHIERLHEGEYKKAVSPYVDQQIDFGFQFHSFAYPTEHATEGELIANYSRVVMKDGVIAFVRPEECEIQHRITDYSIRPVRATDIKTAAEVLEEVEYKERGQA